MDNKTQLEKDIVDILINMIPVPWSKIAFWAERNKSSGTFFFGYREAETDMVITYDTFPDRYDNYIYPEIELPVMLLRNVRKIFHHDYDKMGDNIWWEFVCTIEENGKYKYEYFYPNGEEYEYMKRTEFLKKYLDSDYICVNSKYPSKEFVPADKYHHLF